MCFKAKILFVLFLILFCNTFFAEPTKVKVGSYILNVGNFDPALGTYDLSFYVWVKWDKDINGFTAENFELMNAKNMSLELIEELPGYKFYSGQGTFFQKIDMANFPFDSHEISLELEDKLYDVTKLVYVPDTNWLSSENPDIAVLGWKNNGAKIEFVERYYDTWNTTYSRYIHKINVSRPLIDSLKVFLPIIFLSLLGFFTFLINIRKFSERLSMSVFTFMAAIAYQIQVNVTIPPLGFFTIADKAMIAIYAGLLFATIYTIYIQWYEEKNKEAVASRTNKFVISFYFIFQLLVFLVIFVLDYLF